MLVLERSHWTTIGGTLVCQCHLHSAHSSRIDAQVPTAEKCA